MTDICDKLTEEQKKMLEELFGKPAEELAGQYQCVKVHAVGESTTEADERANRVENFMNDYLHKNHPILGLMDRRRTDLLMHRPILADITQEEVWIKTMEGNKECSDYPPE